MLVKNMTISAALLGLFAIAGTTMVSLTHEITADRIAMNQRAALLRNLHTLVTPSMHSNDIFNDVIYVTNKELLGSKKPVAIYRARQDTNNVAAIINSVAPEGYNGDIQLLVAIKADGQLAGVRVTQHQETPGLGDSIEADRSDWIHSFDNKSLQNPGKDKWKVKRDGGEFDQFTGATISPRAIVKAVYNTLTYFQQNQEMIFDKPADIQTRDMQTDE